MKYSCALLLISFYFVSVHGRSEEEIKIWFMNTGASCMKDHPVTSEDIEALHQHKVPDNENSKCLLACVYRKVSWLDDKGMFNAEEAHSMAEKEHVEDKTKLDGSKKLFDNCKKVNDEAVSDKEKGCERAALLTKCFVENAEKFGLKLQ